MVTSIDQDGTEKGFDIELMQRAAQISKVPVIASGGMGTPAHATELLRGTEVDAVAVARSLHYDRLSVPELRQTLLTERYGVRAHDAA